MFVRSHPSLFALRSSLFALLSSLFALLPLAGCSTTAARVAEVSSARYTHTIGPADKKLFMTDRASRFTFESEPLPLDSQREEVYVRWTGRGVDMVKFEYRQVDRPNEVLVQTFVPNGRQWHIFTVRGQEFITGGPVSAWRVSLWANGTNNLVAERTSAIW